MVLDIFPTHIVKIPTNLKKVGMGGHVTPILHAFEVHHLLWQPKLYICHRFFLLEFTFAVVIFVIITSFMTYCSFLCH